MNLFNALNNLTLAQLEALLSHVKMGEKHLKKYLTPLQIKNLLTIHELSENQKQTVGSDKLELQGNIALLVNTIFTSMLGGSLGFSAFSDSTIATLPILISLSTLIAIVSGGLTWASYRLVKKKGEAAIVEQKFALLQIRIFTIINNK